MSARAKQHQKRKKQQKQKINNSAGVSGKLLKLTLVWTSCLKMCGQRQLGAKRRKVKAFDSFPPFLFCMHEEKQLAVSIVSFVERNSDDQRLYCGSR
jgi:hypothetical protein